MIASAARIRKVISGAAAHFVASHGFVYSAAVAFNLLLSAIPVLFLAFAAASLVIGRSELPFAMLTSILRETFPYGAQVLVPNLRKLFASGATFGLLGTLLLLASSFSATDAVHTSLSVMMGERQGKRFWRSVSFHMVLVVTMTLMVFAAILVPPLWSGLAFLTKGFSARWDAAYHVLLAGIGDAVLAGTIFAGGVLSYRYLAPHRVRMENALTGSLAFLLLFYAIKGGFGFYVKKFSRLNVIYGSLFSIICFIIVAYLFAAAYLFCASIIGVMEREDGEDVLPEREGVYGSGETPGGD